MKTPRVNAKQLKIAEKAAKVLKRGGVILYPTETVYGLGVDANNPLAVEKVNQIKGRPDDKRLLVFASVPEKYVTFTKSARILAEKFWPGPLSLVLDRNPDAPETFLPDYAETGVGMRNPDHPLCQALVQTFDGVITSTSANRSGHAPGVTVDDVLAQLGDDAKLIDMVIDGGRLHASPPSTVVDCRGNEVKVLREGAIDSGYVLNVLEE